MSTRYGYTPKRCMALDQDGKRCISNKKVQPINYHGDGEIYGFGTQSHEPSWVVTYLCQQHRTAKESK